MLSFTLITRKNKRNENNKQFKLNILGLGVAMLTVTSLITTYYAVITAYCMFFFFASINLELPWQNCESSWSTCSCRDVNQNDSVQDPWNGTRKECSM